MFKKGKPRTNPILKKPGVNKKHKSNRKELTPAEQKYVKNVILGTASSKTEAAKMAGLDRIPTKATAEELIQKHKSLIQNRFLDSADDMVDIISDLAKNSKNDNVRLSAARDLLDRAGFNVTNKTEVTENRYIAIDNRLTHDLITRLAKQKEEKLITIDNDNNKSEE